MNSYRSTINFLKTNTFVPHRNGNQLLYGLNAFGSNSIIQYDNQIWKFIHFIALTNNAVYINKNGEEFIFNQFIFNDSYNITRMEAVEDNIPSAV
jgi:hypothetical protein